MTRTRKRSDVGGKQNIGIATIIRRKLKAIRYYRHSASMTGVSQVVASRRDLDYAARLNIGIARPDQLLAHVAEP